jgi:FkbM family methyltransferase
MTGGLLGQAAARLRRSLGYDALAARLEAIEQRVAGLEGPRYPSGPLYLGDHLALVATRWGAKMAVDTRDSLLAPWLLLDGLWESHVTAWMHETIREGHVFVDVGANVGYFTLLAGRLVGPRGRVVAVEAHPGLVDILRRNVAMNGLHGRTQVWHRAAWSEATTLDFHERVHFSANSSIGRSDSQGLTDLADRENVVSVEAAPLDDLLQDLPRVDVVKVDVEGSEVQAFTGMDRTLRANPGAVVLFEWSPAQIRQVGRSPSELLDLLEGHGLRLRLLEDNLASIDRSRLFDLPYGNVVAAR